MPYLCSLASSCNGQNSWRNISGGSIQTGNNAAHYYCLALTGVEENKLRL